MLRHVSTFCLTFALLWSAGVVHQAKANPLRGRSLRVASEPESILCRPFFTITTYEDDDDHHQHELLCNVLDDGVPTTVQAEGLPVDNIDPSFVEQHLTDIRSRRLYVRLPGARVVSEAIPGYGSLPTRLEVPDGTSPVVVDVASPRHLRSSVIQDRQLQRQTMGTRQILLVRVSTDDATANVDATAMVDAVFATDQYSVTTQYQSCSRNQLSLEPFDTGLDTFVLNITVPGSAADFGPATLYGAANNMAKDLLGASNSLTDLGIDTAIFCLPRTGKSSGFKATASFEGHWIMARDSYCSNAAALLHELGHNLGLGHAGDASWEYGDTTSIMGSVTPGETELLKCFNGQNLWRLEWFDDRSVDVAQPMPSSRRFELATYLDYDITSIDQVVVIKVRDVFLVYNRAKDFNSGQTEKVDQVTIVQEQDINSFLLGSVDEANPFYVLSLDGVPDLTIEVCDRFDGTSLTPDSFVIAMGYDASPCESTSATSPASISLAATNVPTASPSLSPTLLPTESPTSVSSLRPTTTPTLIPSTVEVELQETATPTVVLETAAPTARASYIIQESHEKPTEAPLTRARSAPVASLVATGAASDSSAGASTPDTTAPVQDRKRIDLSIVLWCFLAAVAVVFAAVATIVRRRRRIRNGAMK